MHVLWFDRKIAAIWKMDGHWPMSTSCFEPCGVERTMLFLRWSTSRWVSHFLNFESTCLYLFSPQQTIILSEIQHTGQCAKTLVDMKMEKSMRMRNANQWSLESPKIMWLFSFLLNNLCFGLTEKSMPFEKMDGHWPMSTSCLKL